MEHALKLLQVQSPEFRSLTSNRLSTQAISFDQLRTITLLLFAMRLRSRVNYRESRRWIASSPNGKLQITPIVPLTVPSTFNTRSERLESALEGW
jgi:hypothetical protein